MDSRRPIRPIMPSTSRGAAPKLCRVCGDLCGPATHQHNRVRCCRDCLQFFRVSILGNRQYSCRGVPTGGCCRRTCKSCRLTKCYEVGMRAEDIQLSPSQMEARQFQDAFVDGILSVIRTMTIQFLYLEWAHDPVQLARSLRFMLFTDSDMRRRVTMFFFGEASVVNRPPDQTQ